MRLHKQVLHVYVFGHVDDAVAACERLGLAKVKDKDVWRDGTATGIVEAVRLPGPAMLICLGDERRKRWKRLPPRDDRLAEVHLTYGLYTGQPREPETLDKCSRVLAVLPVPGCYLLERPGDRTFLLVGPADQEDRLDDLAWPAAIGLVPPIARYLWETARLRSEQKSFDDQRERVQRRQTALVTQVARLLDERPVAEPTYREEYLRDLQWNTALVTADEARLRVYAVTVDAIVANMSVATDWSVATGLTTARWLVAEITAEADRSHYAVALAEPISRAAEAANALQLRRLSERAGYLMTVQTSVIAAVLLVLAAVQSVAFTWPTPYFLKLPFIVTLGLAGLVVPVWAGRRPTAEEPHRRPPRWLAIPVVALGAAAGWLVASAVSKTAIDGPAPVLVGAGAAVAAALVTAGGVLYVWRRTAKRWVARGA